eukprot:TRINITY_DN45561_c0_g1_i1.p1 TRINITY_DN45561_c0_g1~~TRINITY_DN45561_c0_g1_i1.p1  ORF type:complete len:105 (-),score=0.73 TRINITY_DN45561_c0_g1_i1:97-411(-)
MRYALRSDLCLRANCRQPVGSMRWSKAPRLACVSTTKEVSPLSWVGSLESQSPLQKKDKSYCTSVRISMQCTPPTHASLPNPSGDAAGSRARKEVNMNRGQSQC